jgi:hypothetical protein
VLRDARKRSFRYCQRAGGTACDSTRDLEGGGPGHIHDLASGLENRRRLGVIRQRKCANALCVLQDDLQVGPHCGLPRIVKWDFQRFRCDFDQAVERLIGHDQTLVWQMGNHGLMRPA